MIKSFVKKGEYFDSVSLMIVSKEVKKIQGVTEATVVMATQENMSILKMADLYLKEFEKYDDTDLLIVIESDEINKFEEIFDKINSLLETIRNKKNEQENYTPKSIEASTKFQPDSNLALISIAGKYAGKEAMKALRLGLHVMLFSDNVNLKTEIELKKYAVANRLLMMGPDCGTSIINGVPLAFSNAVKKGNIGLVAASGTGLQEVSSIISEKGLGISQAIGTGGRDVSKEVGGMMFLFAMELLAKDEQTDIIVLISKPPHPSVLKKINDQMNDISKPVVGIFLGADKSEYKNSKIHFTDTLEEAALVTCSLAKNESIENFQNDLLKRKENYTHTAQKQIKKLPIQRKYIRGLFSGGTLCDETMVIFKQEIDSVFSNRAKDHNYHLEDVASSKKNTLLDLGEDVFTVGRLHPMIDFDLRNQRMIQEANDPETAILLFDLVLGYGANENPMKDLLPTIQKVHSIAPEIQLLCSVTGTKEDPQDKEQIIEILTKNNVQVLPTNAAASYLSLEMINQLQNRGE